jgi:hypothetical protein
MRAILARKKGMLGCENRQDLSKESVHSHGLLQQTGDVLHLRLYGNFQSNLRAGLGQLETGTTNSAHPFAHDEVWGDFSDNDHFFLMFFSSRNPTNCQTASS